MNLFLVIGFLILFPSADHEWDLKKASSGIEIYTRDFEGSSFKEFKGVTVIQNTTLIRVLEVIMDIENYESLFPDCMNPRLLEQIDQWHVIQYIQTKGPFTVKDRDSIFELIVVTDRNGKHTHINLKPLPDYMAENKDMVRIRVGSGFWDLEEDNNGNVKVIYQFHSEPGGDVPAWIANSFVVNHPFKTLENLKERVKK
jgi:hypothetical protein